MVVQTVPGETVKVVLGYGPVGCSNSEASRGCPQAGPKCLSTRWPSQGHAQPHIDRTYLFGSLSRLMQSWGSHGPGHPYLDWPRSRPSPRAPIATADCPPDGRGRALHGTCHLIRVPSDHTLGVTVRCLLAREVPQVQYYRGHGAMLKMAGAKN